MMEFGVLGPLEVRAGSGLVRVPGVKERALLADLVVNATGPWCERLAAMAGATVPVQPSPGVLLALVGRLCDLVVNRLHPAGDGDIVLPQRRLSIVGTSSWTVEDPDDLAVPDEHVAAMYREGAKLVPAVASAPERAAWSAARPLIGAVGGAGVVGSAGVVAGADPRIRSCSAEVATNPPCPGMPCSPCVSANSSSGDSTRRCRPAIAK
jgi:glycerol-3-phosphate dehydrogenase